MSTKHINAIQRRIEWLDSRIEEDPEHSGYNKAEKSALEWAIREIEDEEKNVHYRRAFEAGERHLLKFYKKTLKKAIKTDNVTALQFMLDRTNEWLEERER